MQFYNNNPWLSKNFQVSIVVEEHGSNTIIARCPEFDLSIQDVSKGKAVKRLESLIIYCLTVSDDFGISKGLFRSIEQDGIVDIKQFISTTVH